MSLPRSAPRHVTAVHTCLCSPADTVHAHHAAARPCPTGHAMPRSCGGCIARTPACAQLPAPYMHTRAHAHTHTPRRTGACTHTSHVCAHRSRRTRGACWALQATAPAAGNATNAPPLRPGRVPFLAVHAYAAPARLYDPTASQPASRRDTRRMTRAQAVAPSQAPANITQRPPLKPP